MSDEVEIFEINEHDVPCAQCRGLSRNCDFCFGLGFLQVTSRYEDELKEIEDGL